MNKIFNGDSLEILKTLESGSVQTCVTSPPYFGLRDYGMPAQMGLEETPEAYVAKLVELFREVRRVLKDDGTLWLNLGDSYAAGGNGGHGAKQQSNRGTRALAGKPKKAPPGLKSKDLVGIPWRVAFALQADGWYLRQDIIWSKPNPMPESVTDRCTKSHEYIFLLSKSPKYYFDADEIKERAIYGGTEERIARAVLGHKSNPTNLHNGMRVRGSKGVLGDQNSARRDVRAGKGRIAYEGKRTGENSGKMSGQQSFVSIPEFRNKRSVWSIPTKSYKDAHFATFPMDLIKPCILAGAPMGGVCLDPFMGSGTTAVVAMIVGRQYIGIELNPAYIKIAESRIKEYERACA